MDYKSGNIDLHIHSTASDGSLDPLEILSLAEKTGLKAIALTDHDSIEGSKAVLRSNVRPCLKFLSGVEISAAAPDFFKNPGSFHILGYGFQVDHPRLNQSLKAQRDARKNRNPLIIERLCGLGMKLSLEEVIAESPKEQIGRPHIAKVMVKKGFVRSINEAFDNFIGKGKPAYVDKARIATKSAIELILTAGGVPVLAHPGLLEDTDSAQYDSLFVQLKAMGLKGIEAYYPSHAPEQTGLFVSLAKKHHLLITGGTDFHGAINPEIQLGSGNGDLSVPYGIYEALDHELNRLQAASSF